MKTYLAAAIFIITCAAYIETAGQNDDVFNRFGILEGKWIMKTNNGAIGEEWTKINKGHFQNRGYMIRGYDTIITERVALTNTKKGIFYTSTVENQNNKQPVAFTLTSSANNIFVFENHRHDFPKRISYKIIKNKDSLNAWIDDGKQIPAKKTIFLYSRQK